MWMILRPVRGGELETLMHADRVTPRTFRTLAHAVDFLKENGVPYDVLEILRAQITGTEGVSVDLMTHYRKEREV